MATVEKATETRLRDEIEKLRAEVECRRLRARDATELLRESFKLRTNCNRVDHAAKDALNELLALKVRTSEEVARRTSAERMLKVYAVCDSFGCGNLATCFGEHETSSGNVVRSCDAHCGHGDESRDWCLPIERLYDEMHTMLETASRDYEIQDKQIEKLTAQRDRLAEDAKRMSKLVNQAQQLGLELRNIDGQMQLVATKPEPHVHPDSRCYRCVSTGCEEPPLFCTEHAGVAVTIAQEGIVAE